MSGNHVHICRSSAPAKPCIRDTESYQNVTGHGPRLVTRADFKTGYDDLGNGKASSEPCGRKSRLLKGEEEKEDPFVWLEHKE